MPSFFKNKYACIIYFTPHLFPTFCSDYFEEEGARER